MKEKLKQLKTYYDYLEQYEKYLSEVGKARRTQRTYLRKVRDFFLFVTKSETKNDLSKHLFSNPTESQFIKYADYDETTSGATNTKTGLNCFIEMLNSMGIKCEKITYIIKSKKTNTDISYMKKDFIEDVADSCKKKKESAGILLCFEWLLDGVSLSVVRKRDYNYTSHSLTIYRDQERKIVKTIAKLSEKTAKILELAFDEMEWFVEDINSRKKDKSTLRESDYLFQSEKSYKGAVESDENIIGKEAVDQSLDRAAENYFETKKSEYSLSELKRMIGVRNIKESGKCYLCAKYKDINLVMSLVNEVNRRTFVRAQAYSPQIYPELYE